MKQKNIDIEKIIQDNQKVNSSDLARNLKALGKLQKQGINIGPDYQLGSPFSRPNSKNIDSGGLEPVLKLG